MLDGKIKKLLQKGSFFFNIYIFFVLLVNHFLNWYLFGIFTFSPKWVYNIPKTKSVSILTIYIPSNNLAVEK